MTIMTATLSINYWKKTFISIDSRIFITGTRHMAVIWQPGIIFTPYYTASFISPFFTRTTNQSLKTGLLYKSPVELLPCSWTMFIIRSLLNSLFSLRSYLTENSLFSFFSHLIHFRSSVRPSFTSSS
jgi:hypothetical protein